MGKKAKLSEPIPVDFAQTLSERYLSYAMSTIMARSLPDVRDGLKPVHRRLLHAMRLLRLDPRSGFKKCARVVGDVIGKYHPHGEVAVYDAMVRLAQEFAVRY
ncbi:MAG TPA: DNA gyrase subunit A, partial [Alphaproteobacteria bacterium]|nr:DNA gyrase subunit A [Alphaproteobacteria bacterium]